MLRALLPAILATSFAIGSPALATEASADRSPPPSRNQSGSLNYAPRPALFVVVAIDEYHRILRLRARNGAEADVHVDDRIHDLATLRPGDLVQVDFFVSGAPDEPLAAATIWPLR